MEQHATAANPQVPPTPTVSVVVITYNSARTIDATLASIAAQDRRPDEVVVSDDASSDDTLAIVERWRDRLPLVILANDRNVGSGCNRARAHGAATQDLIAPVDADDVWLPDHLATLVPLAADDLTIVGTRYVRWQPGLALGSDAGRRVPPPDRQPAAVLRANFLFCGALYPRRRLAEVGASTSRRVDDWENWVKLIVLAGCRVVDAPHPTVLYRTSPTQVSGGDGCLPDEIELCERLLADPRFAHHRSIVEATLQRFVARRHLLDGLGHRAAGRPRDARAAFRRAIATDRSLRGGMRPPPEGSIALRAAAALVVPAFSSRVRDRRLRRQLVIHQEQPAERATRPPSPPS